MFMFMYFSLKGDDINKLIESFLYINYEKYHYFYQKIV